MKPLTAFLGIIGGVFALFSGGYRLWLDVHKAPHTTVSNESSKLWMTYDPTVKKLHFAFRFLIDNYGTEGDVIGAETATLAYANRVKESSPDLTFFEGENPVDTPFPVAIGASRDLRCELTLLVRDDQPPFRAAREAEERERFPFILRVGLSGKRSGKTRESYEVCFCPDLSDELLNEMFSAKTLYTRTFIGCNCNCGASQ